MQNRPTGAADPGATPESAKTCAAGAPGGEPCSALRSADFSAFSPDVAVLVERLRALPEADRRAVLEGAKAGLDVPGEPA